MSFRARYVALILVGCMLSLVGSLLIASVFIGPEPIEVWSLGATSWRVVPRPLAYGLEMGAALVALGLVLIRSAKVRGEDKE